MPKTYDKFSVDEQEKLESQKKTAELVNKYQKMDSDLLSKLVVQWALRNTQVNTEGRAMLVEASSRLLDRKN